jgi:hypothetical protein
MGQAQPEKPSIPEETSDGRPASSVGGRAAARLGGGDDLARLEEANVRLSRDLEALRREVTALARGAAKGGGGSGAGPAGKDASAGEANGGAAGGGPVESGAETPDPPGRRSAELDCRAEAATPQCANSGGCCCGGGRIWRRILGSLSCSCAWCSSGRGGASPAGGASWQVTKWN